MPKKTDNQTQKYPLIAKLQSLSVWQKACLFTLFMGIAGAAVGGTLAEIEVRSCNAEEHCFMLDINQKRIDGIKSGSFAGMSAALFASLPAIIQEFRR